MTASYWYSTSGRIHLRISSTHLDSLDEAFKQHTRIQIVDEQLFGPDTTINAFPSQGTMTAGDLHYGLYRQPPLWQQDDTTSLDMFLLEEQEKPNKRKFMRKTYPSNRMDVCCIIS